jgi:hypothetical protein
MRTVVIESPFAGDVARNIRYAKACVRDCLKRGEAPYASHLYNWFQIFTQEGLLDDLILEEREQGMLSGFAIGNKLDATVVYEDLGRSNGMTRGIARAQAHEQEIEYRMLGPNWDK